MLLLVNFLAPVSRSKSHSMSVCDEVRRRMREMSGEMSRASVRKAFPESESVVSKMLRRVLMMAPPKLASKKWRWARRQENHSCCWGSGDTQPCLLYTSDAADDLLCVD